MSQGLKIWGGRVIRGAKNLGGRAVRVGLKSGGPPPSDRDMPASLICPECQMAMQSFNVLSIYSFDYLWFFRRSRNFIWIRICSGFKFTAPTATLTFIRVKFEIKCLHLKKIGCVCLQTVYISTGKVEFFTLFRAKI